MEVASEPRGSPPVHVRRGLIEAAAPPCPSRPLPPLPRCMYAGASLKQGYFRRFRMARAIALPRCMYAGASLKQAGGVNRRQAVDLLPRCMYAGASLKPDQTVLAVHQSFGSPPVHVRRGLIEAKPDAHDAPPGGRLPRCMYAGASLKLYCMYQSVSSATNSPGACTPGPH